MCALCLVSLVVDTVAVAIWLRPPLRRSEALSTQAGSVNRKMVLFRSRYTECASKPIYGALVLSASFS